MATHKLQFSQEMAGKYIYFFLHLIFRSKLSIIYFRANIGSVWWKSARGREYEAFVFFFCGKNHWYSTQDWSLFVFLSVDYLFSRVRNAAVSIASTHHNNNVHYWDNHHLLVAQLLLIYLMRMRWRTGNGWYLTRCKPSLLIYYYFRGKWEKSERKMNKQYCAMHHQTEKERKCKFAFWI